MKTEIMWDTDSKILDLPDGTSESEFYKEVSGVLSSIAPPARVTVSCPYGTALFQVIKKSGAFFVKEDSNAINFPYDGNSYPEVYLTMVNPDHNNYKFYRLTQRGNDVIATYGRIGAEKGDPFGERTYTYPKHMFWVKYREKLAKGYVDQSKIYLAKDTKPVKQGTPGTSQGTPKQPDGPAYELYMLLKQFAKRHVEAACITTHINKEMVIQSRKLLDTLYKRKSVKAFNNTLLKLIAICPRKVSQVAELQAGSPADFAKIIDREENLLAAMEALITDDIPDNAAAPNEGFHDIEVFIATDKQRKQVMDHLSPQLHSKVKQIYRVIPQNQQKRFDAYLKQHGIKKVMQLWHGSRNENWLSIIQNSLKLRPDAVITGKMFGDGIYFAPSSMKSWNYTSYRGTTWARGNSDKGFMGLYATAYGTPLDVYNACRYSQATLGNKNCVHAHAGQALLNDEIVFYNEDAVVLNYIVEFGA